ncbi:MAG: biosynthetic arginine decarboxylase, partial [Thermoanaerobaculia bacterium]
MTTQTQEEVAAQQRDGWSVEDASALYMIDRWGSGYFDVNGNGDLTVSPLREKGKAIPIIDAVHEAQLLNLGTPLLIRFQDLLRDRVETLNNAFNRA